MHSARMVDARPPRNTSTPPPPPPPPTPTTIPTTLQPDSSGAPLRRALALRSWRPVLRAHALTGRAAVPRLSSLYRRRAAYHLESRRRAAQPARRRWLIGPGSATVHWLDGRCPDVLCPHPGLSDTHAVHTSPLSPVRARLCACSLGARGRDDDARVAPCSAPPRFAIPHLPTVSFY